MNTYPKSYLGNSVYVTTDGHGIIITTENGLPGDPSNSIYLEPEVWSALQLYVGRLAAAQLKEDLK